MDGGFLFGGKCSQIKCSKTDCGDGCTTVNILKTTELYSLN